MSDAHPIQSLAMPYSDALTDPSALAISPALGDSTTAYGLAFPSHSNHNAQGNPFQGLPEVYAPNPGDFSGNGQGDILWHNPVTGQSSVGTPDSATRIDPVFSDPNWQLVGLGDFDGDRHTDLLLRNPTTGEIALGFLQDTELRERQILGLKIAAPWELKTTIDLNHDGKDDLLWQHPATGQLVAWHMDGTKILGSAVLPSVHNRDWQLIGSGDFSTNTDSTTDSTDPSEEQSSSSTDLVWHHPATGETVLWHMKHGKRHQIRPLARQENQDRRLVGILDTDGDQKPDLLWQDQVTGAVTSWLMAGSERRAEAEITPPGTSAQVLLWKPMTLSRPQQTEAAANTTDPASPTPVNSDTAHGDNPTTEADPFTPPAPSPTPDSEVPGSEVPDSQGPPSGDPIPPIDDWFSQNLSDDGLAAIARSHFQDGKLDRNDMIAILTEAGSDDAQVDSQEFADLKTLVDSATDLQLDDYVHVLADNVVNGDPANQWFTGGARQRQTLGNLAVGSSAEQLNQLVDKWFLGGDRPTPLSSSHNYQYIEGSLFQDGPSLFDIQQAQLGNCYYLAVLGSIAHERPQTIQEMFIDNGDGTFTVRFFNGSRAEYVTVDRYLPTLSNGNSPSAQFGSDPNNTNNELWVALAEKAYAQLSESNWIGQDQVNSYEAIEGGWTSKPTKHILSHQTSTKQFADLDANDLIGWVNSDAVLTVNIIGDGDYGIIDNHAYSLTDYDPASQTFHLHNPWGKQHADVTLEQLGSLHTYLVRSFQR